MYADSAEICQITYPFENDNRPYVPVKIYGFHIHALLDSGSNYTIISKNIYSKLKINRLNKPPKSVSVRSASGDQLQILGLA